MMKNWKHQKYKMKICYNKKNFIILETYDNEMNCGKFYIVKAEVKKLFIKMLDWK